VLGPTTRHVYRCRCGRRIVAVQGDGTWPTWTTFEQLAEEHARECAAAGERWDLIVPERR
jgi:hypothetical protein